MPTTRPLKVFLCHASADKPAVRKLYQRLSTEGWIDPWLDEEKLSFGQHWTTVIEDALDAADVVLIFLSHNSVQREGFVQRELNYAWELSLEKPIETIFLIPFRLDDCEVPRHLSSRQWGDYFGDKEESTYQILLRSLKQRHEQKKYLEEEDQKQRDAINERAECEAKEKATPASRNDAPTYSLPRKMGAKSSSSSMLRGISWLALVIFFLGFSWGIYQLGSLMIPPKPTQFFVPPELSTTTPTTLPTQTPAPKLTKTMIPQKDGSLINFCVSNIPLTREFPDVKLIFSASDQNMNPINNDQDQEISISDNGQVFSPLLPGIKVNSENLGIDFYIVIDRGNRTDQFSAKNILFSFFNYYDQTQDQVFIFTDEGNNSTSYFLPSTGISLIQAITNYPSEKTGAPWTIDIAIQDVLKEIEGGFNKCQKPKFLFLILGDQAMAVDNFIEIAQRAKTTFTKIVIFHTPNPRDRLVEMEYSYRSFAEEASGYYVSILNGEEGSFFNTLAPYRKSYSVTYRSTNGVSGNHEINFVYQGIKTNTLGLNSYSISLLHPQVNLIMPSIIERTSKKIETTGYIYDKTTETVFVQVTFPDMYPRKISSSATLIINQLNKPELRIPVTLSTSIGDATGSTYIFSWNLDDFADASRSDLYARVEIIDELGLISVSQSTPVSILNHIPLSLMAERYLVYVMVGIVALLIVALALMWQRIGKLAKRILPKRG